MALTNAACSGSPEGAAAAANIVCQIPRLQRAAIVDRLVAAVRLRAVDPANLARQLRFLFSLRAETNWKFALAFSTCMIPLKISRSSLRQGPVGLPAKRLDLRPLLIVDPKQMRFHRRASKSVDQPLESKHG
jgi:hypothetical protein